MKPIIASLSLALVALLAWWILGMLREDPVTLEPLDGTSAFPLSHDPPPTSALQGGTPIERIEDVEKAQPEAPAPDAPEQDEPIASAPAATATPFVDLATERNALFAETYGDHKSVQLRREANRLHKEVEALAAELFQRRYDQGRFEIYPWELGPEGNRLPLKRTVPAAPDGVAWKVFNDPDAREWHYVVLPRVDYPAFYQAYDEREWVRNRFEELEGDS